MLGVKNNLKRKKSSVLDSFRAVSKISVYKKNIRISIAEKLLVQINSGENEILFI